MNTLLTGAAFGAALTAAGVHQPSVIVSQLKLENWHMIQAFLTAAASSALYIFISEKAKYAYFKPRAYSPVGLFASYDGNIIGGVLLGVGMALSGSCPGTVFPQIAFGIRSGFYALEGGAIGGIFWIGILEPLIAKRLSKESPRAQQTLTVYEGLGVSRTAVLIGFEAMCAAVIASTALLTSPGSEAKIHPVLGGAILGATQLVSILARRSLLGISGAFDELGHWFWGLLKGNPPKGNYNTLLFTLGVIGGSWVLGQAVPSVAQPSVADIGPWSAGVGGFLMIVGSRMAGGCTSGHGISYLSVFSTSSWITIATAFASGILVARLFM